MNNWKGKKERLFLSLGVVAKEEEEDDKDPQAEEQERQEREVIAMEEEALRKEVDWVLNHEVERVMAEVRGGLQLCQELLKPGKSELEREEAAEEKPVKKYDLDAILAEKRDKGKKKKGDKGKEKETEKEREKEIENEKAKAAEGEAKSKEAELVSTLRRKNLVDFKAQSNEAVTVIKGYLNINGWLITKGDFQVGVKPTWGRNKQPVSHKTSILPLDPLRLPQIQNTHNFLELCLQQIDDLLRSPNSIEDRLFHLEKLITLLASAKSELTYNQHTNFPQNIFRTDVFLPALPPEIVLEFGILNWQVVVTVVVIQISLLPLQTDNKKTNLNLTISQKLQLKKEGPTAGLSFAWQTKKIEVMDTVKLYCPVATLTQTMKTLERIILLVTELREKLIAISM